jgi:hypothetical protein
MEAKIVMMNGSENGDMMINGGGNGDDEWRRKW